LSGTNIDEFALLATLAAAAIGATATIDCAGGIRNIASNSGIIVIVAATGAATGAAAGTAAGATPAAAAIIYDLNYYIFIMI
jgi:hypothetical protein